MYCTFYGLRERPFELTPDPRYLFLSDQHREALSNVEYGLASAKSLTVLLGEPGTGKTTLLGAALQSERCRHVTCVSISNPTLTRGEFLHTLAVGFGLGTEATACKGVLLERLERLLSDRRRHGVVTALIVDEAQRLEAELLEEVRLLGNMETTREKLLPLVLAGQPELAQRLEEPGFRQLKQRVALRCELEPFDVCETAAYIASRIRTAGGIPSLLFTRESIVLIHRLAAGIPRTIGVLCDNALVSGLALRRQPVDCAIVTEVAHDLSLGPRGDLPGTPQSAAATNEARPPSWLSSRFRWNREKPPCV